MTSQLLIWCLYWIDFCIARPIRFVVGMVLNIYDDDDDDDDDDDETWYSDIIL